MPKGDKSKKKSVVYYLAIWTILTKELYFLKKL